MSRPLVVKKEDEPTRDLILRSAIHHFAMYGYEGAHVRKILGEQGLNVALAHYYFGSKRGLYEAAVHYYFDRAIGERSRRLEAWKQQADGPKDERTYLLLKAYCLPHFLITGEEGGLDYARLALRVLHSVDPYTRSLMKSSHVLRHRYCEQLQAQFPTVSYDLLFRSMESLGVMMLSESVAHAVTLVDADPDERARQSEERATFCARIVTGGLLELFRKA